ncbi:MAG: DUF438 domain-containing protein [Bacillota bacterium]
MNKAERLAHVLERLNADPNSQETRQQARTLVSEISPLELSLAEQKLVEQGMDPSELQHLCAVHLEVLEPGMAEFRAKLPAAHPLDTMIREHNAILGFLAHLGQLGRQLKKLTGYDPGNPAFAALGEVAKNLLDAENHHQREEQVLFPAMEQRGITGPPRIMRMEHEQLRARKHRLLELSQQVQQGMDYQAFLDSLAETAGYLVFNLRDHIYKENNILYPTAVQTIVEESEWAELKSKCDRIGYCPFTKAEWR